MRFFNLLVPFPSLLKILPTLLISAIENKSCASLSIQRLPNGFIAIAISALLPYYVYLLKWWLSSKKSCTTVLLILWCELKWNLLTQFRKFS